MAGAVAAPVPAVVESVAMPAPAPTLVPVMGTISTHAKPTLLVDGERKKVQDGKVSVACGKHRIGQGRQAHVVYVPCGGTVTR
jgi:hypothetical protein